MLLASWFLVCFLKRLRFFNAFFNISNLANTPFTLVDIHVQWETLIPGRLLNSLCKWGDFERAKTTFKMLLAIWFLMCFLKKFRSCVAKNLESVGQRAAKLPAIKLWEWFEGAGIRTRAHWLTGDLSWDLQLWQLVILQPFDLQTPNFQHLKI